MRGAGGIANAFQSYPTLLTGDGAVPAELLASGRGVDLGHRDSRVAIGELRDGRLLLAMTRFNALGTAAAGTNGPGGAACRSGWSYFRVR